MVTPWSSCWRSTTVAKVYDRDTLCVIERVCPECRKRGLGIRELFLVEAGPGYRLYECEYCQDRCYLNTGR